MTTRLAPDERLQRLLSPRVAARKRGATFHHVRICAMSKGGVKLLLAAPVGSAMAGRFLAPANCLSGIIRVIEDRANNADPSIVSPSQITSNQNDYNPTGLQYANVLRLTTDASREITGIQKGSFGSELMVMNVGSSNLTLSDDDGATSAASNRFEFSDNILLAPSEAVELWYDMTSSRWRLKDRGLIARLNSAQTFTGAQTVNVTGFFPNAITAIGTGNGGPTVRVFHESASPAAGDFVWTVSFDGRDSAANSQRYATVGAQILDPTTSSEDGRLNLTALIAGGETNIIQLGPRPYMTNATTTASAANAFLDSGSSPVNELLRSTSSLRFKREVEELDPALADAILTLKPIWYRSKCERDNPDWSWYGLSAEAVAEVDPRLVQWGYSDEDYDQVVTELPPVKDPQTGELVPGGVRRDRVRRPDAKLIPDGVAYGRLSVLLLSIVKRQEERLAALEKAAKTS